MLRYGKGVHLCTLFRELRKEFSKYIRVYVHRKTAMKILVTATISAIDMISNIGGTLGLFSGFSVLSGAELVFWICRCVAKEGRIERRKKKAVRSGKNRKDDLIKP